ncbi:MAG: hypothetical protein ABIN67_09835 [Ferruginibacter sp.]
MKTAKPSSTHQKNTKSKQNETSKKKRGVGGDIGTSAMENAKARTGRGLANEGTIVSYDEER